MCVHIELFYTAKHQVDLLKDERFFPKVLEKYFFQLNSQTCSE